MKQLIYILLALLLIGCNGNDGEVIPDDEYPKSQWGKPLTVTEYEDAAGAKVYSTTTYYYDHLNRLLGYRRVSRYGGMEEEMLNSVYSDKTHIYEIHSYEWLGGALPVVFFHTDTYTDNSFSTIEKRYIKAKNMDFTQTITYRYKGKQQVGYRTVDEGQHPKDFDTQIVYYNNPLPSASLFPQEVEDEKNHIEMVYTDSDGNRSGYYNDNDYRRAQWNFHYGNGYCTYYTSQFGQIDFPRLVRVVFYPESK